MGEVGSVNKPPCIGKLMAQGIAVARQKLATKTPLVFVVFAWIDVTCIGDARQAGHALVAEPQAHIVQPVQPSAPHSSLSR